MNLFIIIIGFILLSRYRLTNAANATLNCDSFEYKRIHNSTGNIHIIRQSTGICMPYGVDESYMFICGPQGSSQGFAYFASLHCSGDVIDFESFQSFLDRIVYSNGGIYRISDAVVTCCTGNYCNYTLSKTYDTNTCNDSTDGVSTYNHQTAVIGACAGFIPPQLIKYTSCSNGVATWNAYFGSNCDGNGNYTNIPSIDGSCSDGKISSISCGTAVNTCKEYTFLTTQTPTTAPTPTPCDGVQYTLISNGDGSKKKEAYGAGICEPNRQLIISKMWVCGTDGNIAMAHYSNIECSGEPDVIQSFNDTISPKLQTGYSVSDVVSTCCTGNYCSFAEISTYNTQSCNDSKVGVSIDSTFTVTIDACSGEGAYTLRYVSCNNGSTRYNIYFNKSECTGDFMAAGYRTNNDCDAYGKQQSVTCKTAVDTCLDKYNVVTPTTTGSGTTSTGLDTTITTTVSEGMTTVSETSTTVSETSTTGMSTNTGSHGFTTGLDATTTGSVITTSQTISGITPQTGPTFVNSAFKYDILIGIAVVITILNYM